MDIFVFGSNRQGRHGAGAALHAKRYYGAVQGKNMGLQGCSYAVITKELRSTWPPVTLSEVACGIRIFLRYAAEHPEDKFHVTPIGCGLAGFTPSEIAPMFRKAPSNVRLPTEFEAVLSSK